MYVTLHNQYFVSPSVKNYVAENSQLNRETSIKLQQDLLHVGDCEVIDESLIQIGDFLLQQLLHLDYDETTKKMVCVKADGLLGGILAFGVFDDKDYSPDTAAMSLLLMRPGDEAKDFREKQKMKEIRFNF